ASRAQIVKSLVFVCDGRPTLALIPGDRRADETKVAAAAGTRYARVARPEEVVAATGFEPGGVAPFPAPGISQVLMAAEFLAHDRGSGGARGRSPQCPVSRRSPRWGSKTLAQPISASRTGTIRGSAPRLKGRAADA